MDRKLYSEGDFTRFAGERVKVRMKPSYRERRVVVGELVGLEEERVTVRTDTDTVALPLREIFEARLDVDWEQIMKEGKNRP
jgi:ribosome maturation factor RimP